MKLTTLFLLVALLGSCSKNEPTAIQNATYFNLKEYFEKEANRLNQSNLVINKSVAVNGETERKKIKINDFKNELNTFISSDINKASWRGAFAIKKNDTLESYTTENEKIPIKKVELKYQNSKLKSIKIFVATTNILYHSSDTLTYIPDSVYKISKTQKIKFLKEKKYEVIGKF